MAPKKIPFNEYKILDDKTAEFYIYKNNEKHTAIVDLDTLKELIKWNQHWNIFKRDDLCYAIANDYGRDVNGKYKLLSTVLLHRFVLKNKNTEGKHIDHRNHNGLDCRRENLRVIEVCENSQYRGKRNINNKSGYRNVFWSSYDDRWLVRLQVNKKMKQLGRFKDVHEAGKFAEKMRQKY